ncbi:aminotransferase class I/II-fold pyridoxal phosphate-dependent enzyme [Streptomyces sp. NPDC020951]|uniref:aminotransferase class I/II-fold pyridoxal phosphate-dependent enzyme n=1 Tax=Streptomyces sp. NPDC020951 TaxID=3365104 RepID=UPI0037B161E2
MVATQRYEPARGSAALCESIAKREGIDRSRIVVTNGGMHGLALSAPKRPALIALAERYGFYVIVDNPYRELRFGGQDLGVAAFNQSDRAIHVNTFTKTLGPGWRVGRLVLNGCSPTTPSGSAGSCVAPPSCTRNAPPC